MNSPRVCIVSRFEPLTFWEWLTLPPGQAVDYLCYWWLAKRGKHCK